MDEIQISPLCLGHNHGPRSIPVQSVNDAGTERGTLDGQAWTMGEEPMDEGPLSMACAGMDHHPLSLVEHEDVLVFVEDVQIHDLGGKG